MNVARMHNANVLSWSKIEYEVYADLKEQTEPEVPLVNYRDNNRKVIKWCPIFTDCLSRHMEVEDYYDMPHGR